MRQTQLEALGGSAARRGFAPALERLIAELQAALVTPGELASAAAELEDGAYESELAGCTRPMSAAATRPGATMPIPPCARSRAGLRERPRAWGARPVLLYGFDDLTEEQLELVAALTGACQVTVAVNYEDREALAPRAALLGAASRRARRASRRAARLRGRYTQSAAPCATSTGTCSRPAPTASSPTRGSAMLECGGERGEAEASAARSPGCSPPESRRTASRWSCGTPSAAGPCSARVLEGFGIPVAVEASVPLARTAAGRGLAALARASLPERKRRGAARLHARPPGRAAGDRRLGRAQPAPRRGADARTS